MREIVIYILALLVSHYDFVCYTYKNHISRFNKENENSLLGWLLLFFFSFSFFKIDTLIYLEIPLRYSMILDSF